MIFSSKRHLSYTPVLKTAAVHTWLHCAKLHQVICDQTHTVATPEEEETAMVSTNPSGIKALSDDHCYC